MDPGLEMMNLIRENQGKGNLNLDFFVEVTAASSYKNTACWACGLKLQKNNELIRRVNILVP